MSLPKGLKNYVIITNTPLRITFAGGGSDMASYYLRFPATCISATINKYVYVLVKKRFDDKISSRNDITVDKYSKKDSLKFTIQREGNSIVRYVYPKENSFFGGYFKQNFKLMCQYTGNCNTQYIGENKSI